MTRGKAALTNGFDEVARELEERRRPKRQRLSIGFAVFMLGLTALFAGLGFWQMQRLGEKEALIAAVEERASLAPVPFPPPAEWIGFDPEVYEFRPVSLTGRFVPSQTVLVFTALTAARGQFSGPGYWVVTPFELDGGTVFVNRGFVPQEVGKSFLSPGAAKSDTQTVIGIARMSEETNPFTPGPDAASRIEWVRNIDRLKQMVDADLAPFAPVYVNQDAGAPGALPQGGETMLSFTNRHLEYALTWFALAVLTPVMLVVWLAQRRRPSF